MLSDFDIGVGLALLMHASFAFGLYVGAALRASGVEVEDDGEEGA